MSFTGLRKYLDEPKILKERSTIKKKNTKANNKK